MVLSKMLGTLYKNDESLKFALTVKKIIQKIDKKWNLFPMMPILWYPFLSSGNPVVNWSCNLFSSICTYMDWSCDLFQFNLNLYGLVLWHFPLNLCLYGLVMWPLAIQPRLIWVVMWHFSFNLHYYGLIMWPF